MAAENAQAVAREVIQEVGKGRKPRKTEIALRNGYSPSSARAGKATQTEAYKEVMRPVVERLIEERDRAVDAMAGKIKDAKYRDLSDAVDKLTKNIQLLTGGSTANVALGIKRLTDSELELLADASGGEAGTSP